MQAIELGATLYVPGTRADLVAIACGRHRSLRSAVICLEDSISQRQVPLALENLARLLDSDWSGGPALFVRPRDPTMLAHVARLNGAERLAGFVIPKVTADNFPTYLATLQSETHRLMPTLETAEALDADHAQRLREQLIAIGSRVLVLRIGGNDLLRTIGARRSISRTAYDGPLGTMIGLLVATFAPFGFQLSAPVLEHFGSPALLRDEVERDIEHGLLTKTAIHPCQIDLIQACYAVAADELAEARIIIATEEAVFASRGAMCESKTHDRWAQSIVRRAELFGIRRASGLAAIA